jgi:hypothetical protein
LPVKRDFLKTKNYVYEDYSMINTDKYYKNLFDITMKMDGNIRNSHDLVSYWMIFMNKQTGMIMANEKIGIFKIIDEKYNIYK